MIPGIAIPQDDGSYVMRVYPPLEIASDSDPTAVTQACWDVVESQVRAFPEPWLWMYKHWRFRPRGAEGERYPPYANHSKAFDKLDTAG